MAILQCGFNYVHLTDQTIKELFFLWNQDDGPDFVTKFHDQIQKVRDALLQEVIASKCPAGCTGKVLLTLDIGLTGSEDDDGPKEGPPLVRRGYQLQFAPVATVLCTDLPLQRGTGAEIAGMVDLTQPKGRGAEFGNTTTEGRGAKWGSTKPS